MRIGFRFFGGILAAMLLAGLVLHASVVESVEPTGGNLTEVSSERAPDDDAGSLQAQAGNVTELNIEGFSITQTWQGYYGNVTGTIFLADSEDNQLYNWSLANPQGEVYASTNQSISWTNIQCLNFTADQTYGDETGNGGGTSQSGTNLTGLEDSYNINSSAVDGVDETFTFGPNQAGTHDLFYTASQEFSEGECISTRVFSSTGPTSNQFEEVLLYEPSSTSVVYAALLEQDLLGFDSATHDFEMLVLEDGHGTDTQTTEYFFFVELE